MTFGRILINSYIIYLLYFLYIWPEIEQALSDNDGLSAEQAIHKLASTLELFTKEELKTGARALEKQLKEKHSNIQHLKEEIQVLCENVKTLNKFLQKENALSLLFRP